MASRSSFYFEEDKLWIEKEIWTDLVGEKSPVALSSVKAAAAEIIRRQGAFIINEEGVGVSRRCDRVSELETLMGEVAAYRLQNGLQAL